jgi:WD40 repeat protein
VCLYISWSPHFFDASSRALICPVHPQYACVLVEAGGGAKTSNVLLAGYADGSIQHWHAPSGKRLSRIALGAVSGLAGGGKVANGGLGLEVLSVAYAPSGAVFSAGASDGRVRAPFPCLRC